MKLLQVVHQFLPEYVGGTEVYVAGLARRLQARGHVVMVFAGGSKPRQYEHDGVPVRTVTGGLRGPKGPARLFLSTFGNREAEPAFLDLLDRFQPDLVHFHHLLGLSTRLVGLARAHGLPTCFTLHDYWFTCPKSQLIDHRQKVCGGPRAGVNCARCAADRIGNPAAVLTAPLFVLRERRVKRAIGSADLILAPSRFMEGMAVRHGLPAEKVRYVPFGIEGAVEHRRLGGPPTGRGPVLHSGRAPGAATRGGMPLSLAGPHPSPLPEGEGTGREGRENLPLRVTYLGGIDHSKGVHVLVDAARRVEIDAMKVRVYGDLNTDPAYAESLRAGPAELMGSAARTAVPGILAETDVLIVPSLWYENSPMVIAEAQAAGVPVIASDLGALPERVTHGVTGLLVPPGDAHALAVALSRLAGDRDLLHLLRTNVAGQEQPSREAHIDQMERIYRELTLHQPPLPLAEG